MPPEVAVAVVAAAWPRRGRVAMTDRLPEGWEAHVRALCAAGVGVLELRELVGETLAFRYFRGPYARWRYFRLRSWQRMRAAAEAARGAS